MYKNKLFSFSTIETEINRKKEKETLRLVNGSGNKICNHPQMAIHRNYPKKNPLEPPTFLMSIST